MSRTSIPASEALKQKPLTLIFGLHRRTELLPRFVHFYAIRGVQRFVCALHDPALHEFVREQLQEHDYVIENCAGKIDGPPDSETQEQLRQDLVLPQAWYCTADVDEFAVHPVYGNFRDCIVAAQAFGADYVPGVLVDRLRSDGTIPPELTAESLDVQFPVACALTSKVTNGQTAKVVLARGAVKITSGHHFATGKPAPFCLQVQHFKWFGQHFWSVIADRTRRNKEACNGWWREGARLYRHYRENGGRFDLSKCSARMQLNVGV